MKGGVRFKTNALDNINEEYVETKKTYEKEQDKVVAEIVGIAGKLESLQYCTNVLYYTLQEIFSLLHGTTKT